MEWRYILCPLTPIPTLLKMRVQSVLLICQSMSLGNMSNYRVSHVQGAPLLIKKRNKNNNGAKGKARHLLLLLPSGDGAVTEGHPTSALNYNIQRPWKNSTNFILGHYCFNTQRGNSGRSVAYCGDQIELFQGFIYKRHIECWLKENMTPGCLTVSVCLGFYCAGQVSLFVSKDGERSISLTDWFPNLELKITWSSFLCRATLSVLSQLGTKANKVYFHCMSV